MDGRAIAKQFLDAFGAGYASGNAAGVKALYGPDSVACYDGSLCRGADAIAASIIGPRVAGGGVALRWASHEGQLTATSQLLVMVTGESQKPVRGALCGQLCGPRGGHRGGHAPTRPCCGVPARRRRVPVRHGALIYTLAHPPAGWALHAALRAQLAAVGGHVHQGRYLQVRGAASAAPAPAAAAAAVPGTACAARTPPPPPPRRFGPGAAPQQVAGDTTGMASGFLQQYYTLYASNRAGLASVYHATKSQMSYEAVGAVGAATIANKLATLPSGRHEMHTLDAVTCLDAGAPVNGVGPAVVALVTGRITIEDQTNPLNFGQAFLLAVEGATPFCANDVFAFNFL